MERLVRWKQTGTPPEPQTGKRRFYVVLLGATAALGGMMFGFDIAIIVGAGPFLVQRFGLSDLSLGWVYSSLLFGCILGSVIAGRLTDRYGRQRILVIVSLLFALTSIGCGLAPSFAALVFARFAGGLAVGAVSVLSPMYAAEVAPAKIRGRMGATYQLSITAGILASFLFNYALRNTGPWNWRWMFLSGALPSLLFFLVLLKAPETPRFLFRIGKKREGIILLQRLLDPDEAMVESAEIEASLAGISSPPDPSEKRALRRVLAVSIILAILVQITGMTVILDYTPLVLKSAGWMINAALVSTFFTGGVNFLSTLVSFWTIDRFGRKPLYIIGSLGMAGSLAMIVLASLLHQARGAVLLGFLLLFIASFASCIGPVFWTLVPEIFPNKARGRAMIVPVVTQWLTSSLVVLAFPLAFDHAGTLATFSFLACMALLQALFAWRVLPETKGKTLEEIEEYWNPARHIIVTAKQMR